EPSSGTPRVVSTRAAADHTKCCSRKAPVSDMRSSSNAGTQLPKSSRSRPSAALTSTRWTPCAVRFSRGCWSEFSIKRRWLHFATYLDEWNGGVHYISGVPDLLEDLGRRFTLVLVTNTHHADLVHKNLRATGLVQHFTAVIASVEHGKRKPSPRIVEHA